jgi:hypothetical protein
MTSFGRSLAHRAKAPDVTDGRPGRLFLLAFPENTDQFPGRTVAGG